MTSKKNLLWYLLKFLGVFCILYFGTTAIIGLTVPVGHYNPFVAQYLDYPSLLRSSLLNGTRILAGVFGIDAYIRDAYHVTMVNGSGVHLVYTCLGYGLLSFWMAFIFANRGSFGKKIVWMLAGCFFIWLINVVRITLVLVAVNKNWRLRSTFDNHTLFNIVAYAFIFFMIWLFQRSEKRAGIINDEL